MSRFQTTINTTKNPTQLGEEINNYLTSQGYKPQEQDGQTIWKKGGAMSNPLFIRCQATNGALQLEAWIRFVILPGVYVGEFPLEGKLLIVQKRQLKKHVDAIIQLAT